MGPIDPSILLGGLGIDSSQADLDGDGIVGPTDLALLFSDWDPCDR